MYYRNVAIFVSIVALAAVTVYVYVKVHDRLAVDKLLFVDSSMMFQAITYNAQFTQLYRYDLKYDNVKGRNNGRFIIGLTRNSTTTNPFEIIFRITDHNGKILSSELTIVDEEPHELVFKLYGGEKMLYIEYRYVLAETVELDRVELQI